MSVTTLCVSATLLLFAVSALTAAPKPDKVTVIQGFRPASEASVSTSALRYFEFDVPPGVTRITVKKEMDWGPGAKAGTLDHGLFDPRGRAFNSPGFRGWMGGSPKDMVITGDRATTDPWFIAGPIQPGRWSIAQLLYTAPPAGLHYKYTVSLSFTGAATPSQMPAVPDYAPGVIKSETAWYPGLVHVHSTHSDGNRPLVEVARSAKAAGFAFLTSNEHNTPTAHYDFASIAKQVPGLLLIPGEEITTPFGHANVIGTPPGAWYDFRMEAGDGNLPKTIARAKSEGAIFSVNHPFAMCTSCLWRYPREEWAETDAVEVWNGPWDSEDRAALGLWDSLLKAGRRTLALGGTDYHHDPDPFVPVVWVHANGLSQASVMKALHAGHITLSDSPTSPMLFLTANGGTAVPGDVIAAPAAGSLKVTARVEGAGKATVHFVWTDGDEVASVPAEGGSVEQAIPVHAGKPAFVRAELIREDGTMAAITDPIFIGSAS